MRLRFDVCRMRRPKRNDDRGEGWGWDPMLSPHLFSNRDSVTIELSCETGFAS